MRTPYLDWVDAHVHVEVHRILMETEAFVPEPSIYALEQRSSAGAPTKPPTTYSDIWSPLA